MHCGRVRVSISETAFALKVGSLGIGVTGEVWSDGQLSNDGRLEIEASSRRESGTFVTTQLVTIGVKQVEEDWLVETDMLIIVVADTLIIGTFQRIEVAAEVTAATGNGDGEELKVFEQECSLRGRQLVQFLPTFILA